MFEIRSWYRGTIGKLMIAIISFLRDLAMMYAIPMHKVYLPTAEQQSSKATF